MTIKKYPSIVLHLQKMFCEVRIYNIYNSTDSTTERKALYIIYKWLRGVGAGIENINIFHAVIAIEIQ